MAYVFRTRRIKDERAGQSDMQLARANNTTMQVLPPDWLARARAKLAKHNASNLPYAPNARPAPRLSHETIALSEARRIGTSLIDPLLDPPDPRLVARLGQDVCLRHRVLPWRNVAGRGTVLAASQEDFMAMHAKLNAVFGPVHFALVTHRKLDRALGRVCHKTLMVQAEQRTPAEASCRNWDAKAARRWGLVIVMILTTCFTLWPALSFLLICGISVLILMLNTALKVAAAAIHLQEQKRGPIPPPPRPRHLPIVTIFVPLFRERDIAGALVERLSRLNYPDDKLDVCLVLEADDYTTQEALANTTLPSWMRPINVPMGTLQTKPRAMNYALSFAKGDIIGVYDAEDAPDPEQINLVVSRFARAPKDVACLQGKLDYYNSTSNWLARCFTVEYATWFRVLLPGLERMGLVIPLGGTTLFFRREVLEELGGWDAHNVTEDADLGIRLVRKGYRTEIIDTTTQEEANARAWPWVKQRSRWLKGYAITYMVHMRQPRAFLRDVGGWRFFGVQLLIGGAILQFLLAPLLWSFWLMLFGLAHPLDGVLSRQAGIALAIVFMASELIGVFVSGLAVIAARKPTLVKWTPTLHLYFPLAAIAAYKGVFELATRPFYWDKTAHGVFKPTQRLSTAQRPAPPRPLLPDQRRKCVRTPIEQPQQLRRPVAAG